MPDQLIDAAIAAGLGYLELQGRPLVVHPRMGTRQTLRTLLKAIKAAKDPLPVPTAEAILAGVLADLGLSNGYAMGTLDGDEHLMILHGVRDAGRAWLRAEAEAILAKYPIDDGYRTKALGGKTAAGVKGFFGRANQYIRELLVAGALALGGPGELDQKTLDAIDRNHQIQVGYLDQFEQEILSEAKPLDATFAARAELYGGSVWPSSQNILRGNMVGGTVFKFEERRHFGPDVPCEICQEQVSQGIVPIGTLRSIGDSTCRSGCHCAFVYRETKDGVPHIAGRGPLHEPAFGRTG